MDWWTPDNDQSQYLTVALHTQVSKKEKDTADIWSDYTFCPVWSWPIHPKNGRLILIYPI